MSSLRKAVYAPKGVILHAGLLHQAFAHCGKFLTAASRRSVGRVSVPLCLVVLSHQIRVKALVSHYLTNKHDTTQAPPEPINLSHYWDIRY